MATHTTRPHPVSLGALGHIEGISILKTGSSDRLCHYFGGIPYALPPTGPYRFRRPRYLPSQYKYGTKSNPGRYTGGTGLCPQPSPLGEPDTRLWDEDCLQLNIWIPAGKAPAKGWPVFFNIHGGYLQWGTANTPAAALAPLLSETEFKGIIVMPSYRLNVFGFVASKELEAEAEKNGESVGNMGFWDQRAALEWTSKHIRAFGGDADNITVGGYSAGAHSTFQQLSHDLHLPNDSAIIKRVIMWSNGPGVQPKTVTDHQVQFDELLACLDIPSSLPPSEKLARLRQVPAKKFIDVQNQMKYHEFRGTSDGAFINKTLFDSINDGTFARKIKDRGIKILNGECRDEHFMYGSWRSPSDSYDSVVKRMNADFPESVVKKIMKFNSPNGKVPKGCDDWPDAFGRIYADMQVHLMERGFVDRLSEGGLTIGQDLLRYRIDWRAKCVDVQFPLQWGVTHGTDMAIWFWGNGMGEGLTLAEKEVLREMNSVFARFVKGDDVRWDYDGPAVMRRLNAQGKTDYWEDDRWDDGVRAWAAINGSGAESTSSKL